MLLLFETNPAFTVEIYICVVLLQAVSNKLMAGFVECLDNEEAEEGPETGDGEMMLFVTYVPCHMSLEALTSSAFGFNLKDAILNP